MSDKVQRLHKVYASGIYPREPKKELEDVYNQPHLALFINGDWLPILPGMIIGLVKDRTKVDGVAPYVLQKVSLREGKEFINLIAWPPDKPNQRRLQLLGNYTGKYRTNVDNADQAVDAAISATRGSNEGTDE